jgi:hypothetical protein
MSGPRCGACGSSIVADDHAVQLAGGAYHAGCVLYRSRAEGGRGGDGTSAGPRLRAR